MKFEMLLWKVLINLFVLKSVSSKKAKRPNIIIIVADDLVRHKLIITLRDSQGLLDFVLYIITIFSKDFTRLSVNSLNTISAGLE